jgi:hypothetical protein
VWFGQELWLETASAASGPSSFEYIFQFYKKSHYRMIIILDSTI